MNSSHDEMSHIRDLKEMNANFRQNKGRRAPPEGAGEEECQDKTCKEAKTSWKSFMKNQLANSGKDCPLDREQLGNATWGLLHTIASKYPTNPSVEQKSEMKEFIRIFGNLYPCSYCAQEFREDLKELPPRLESRQELADWFCQIHNRVNEKLNKPKFDCSLVDQRWRTGWKDGSCL